MLKTGTWYHVLTPSAAFPRDFEVIAVGNLTVRMRDLDGNEWSEAMTLFKAAMGRSFVTEARTR